MVLWSTLVSEFVLAFCSFVFAIMAYSKSLKLLIIFSILSVNASLGVIRLAMSHPTSFVYKWHRRLTNASFLFIPSFFASAYLHQINYTACVTFVILPLALFLLVSKLDPNVLENSVVILSFTAFISILYVCYTQKLVLGLLGVCFVVMAVVSLRSEFNKRMLKGVDLFHYFLIPAVYFMAIGIYDL